MDRGEALWPQVMRVLGEIRRMEEQLDQAPELTAGSMGKPHPLLGELRKHRWLLRGLVDSAGGMAAAGAAVPDVVDLLRAEWESGG
jgi:hypothetical protein